MQTSNNSASFKRRYSYISIKVPLGLFRSGNSSLSAFWRTVSSWVRLRKDWIYVYRRQNSSWRSSGCMDGSLWRKHSIGEAWLLGISQKRRPLRKKIIEHPTKGQGNMWNGEPKFHRSDAAREHGKRGQRRLCVLLPLSFLEFGLEWLELYARCLYRVILIKLHKLYS